MDGFLFNPADSQDAALYILKLRNDKKLRQKMGAAGQKTCENRTIEVQTGRVSSCTLAY